MHRYPTRNVVQPLQVQPIIKKSEPKQIETQTNANKPNIPHDEPENMSTIPPFLLNAVIDDEAGKVDIMALVHGIEVLEKQVNAITCPKTGKQLEYRHLIQDPNTKKVWNPAMSTEVDRLVDPKTIRFIKKRNIPRGENSVYTRLVIILRSNKAVYERLRM